MTPRFSLTNALILASLIAGGIALPAQAEGFNPEIDSKGSFRNKFQTCVSFQKAGLAVTRAGYNDVHLGPFDMAGSNYIFSASTFKPGGPKQFVWVSYDCIARKIVGERPQG